MAESSQPLVPTEALSPLQDDLRLEVEVDRTLEVETPWCLPPKYLARISCHPHLDLLLAHMEEDSSLEIFKFLALGQPIPVVLEGRLDKTPLSWVLGVLGGRDPSDWSTDAWEHLPDSRIPATLWVLTTYILKNGIPSSTENSDFLLKRLSKIAERLIQTQDELLKDPKHPDQSIGLAEVWDALGVVEQLVEQVIAKMQRVQFLENVDEQLWTSLLTSFVVKCRDDYVRSKFCREIEKLVLKVVTFVKSSRSQGDNDSPGLPERAPSSSPSGGFISILMRQLRDVSLSYLNRSSRYFEICCKLFSVMNEPIKIALVWSPADLMAVWTKLIVEGRFQQIVKDVAKWNAETAKLVLNPQFSGKNDSKSDAIQECCCLGIDLEYSRNTETADQHCTKCDVNYRRLVEPSIHTVETAVENQIFSRYKPVSSRITDTSQVELLLKYLVNQLGFYVTASSEQLKNQSDADIMQDPQAWAMSQKDSILDLLELTLVNMHPSICSSGIKTLGISMLKIFLSEKFGISEAIHARLLGYLNKLSNNGRAWRKRSSAAWNVKCQVHTTTQQEQKPEMPENKRKSSMAAMDKKSFIRHDYTGLVNLGCTCYMNSIFQQLFMEEELREFLLSVKADGTESKDKSVLGELQGVFKGLKDSSHRSYDPEHFTKVFKNIDGSPVRLNEQMDADEFFNHLMDVIEQDLKKAQPSDGTKTKIDKNQVLKRVFGGKTVMETISHECEHKSRMETSFLTLRPEVKNSSSVKQSLEKLVTGEVLDPENLYLCEDCNRKVRATRRESLSKLPNRLILSLKRFEFNYEKMERTKLNSYIEFPEFLDMKPYTSDFLNKVEPETVLPEEYFQYRLKGVAIHVGGAESGHYYSIIRMKNNLWYEFNDTIVRPFDYSRMAEVAFGTRLDQSTNLVSPLDASNVPSMTVGPGTSAMMLSRGQNAYMLFYERKTPFPEEPADAQPLKTLLEGIQDLTVSQMGTSVSKDKIEDQTAEGESSPADKISNWKSILFSKEYFDCLSEHFHKYREKLSEIMRQDWNSEAEYTSKRAEFFQGNRNLVLSTLSNFFLVFARLELQTDSFGLLDDLLSVIEMEKGFQNSCLTKCVALALNRDFLHEFFLDCSNVPAKSMIADIITSTVANVMLEVDQSPPNPQNTAKSPEETPAKDVFSASIKPHLLVEFWTKLVLEEMEYNQPTMSVCWPLFGLNSQLAKSAHGAKALQNIFAIRRILKVVDSKNLDHWLEKDPKDTLKKIDDSYVAKDTKKLLVQLSGLDYLKGYTDILILEPSPTEKDELTLGSDAKVITHRNDALILQTSSLSKRPDFSRLVECVFTLLGDSQIQNHKDSLAIFSLMTAFDDGRKFHDLLKLVMHIQKSAKPGESNQPEILLSSTPPMTSIQQMGEALGAFFWNAIMLGHQAGNKLSGEKLSMGQLMMMKTVTDALNKTVRSSENTMLVSRTLLFTGYQLAIKVLQHNVEEDLKAPVRELLTSQIVRSNAKWVDFAVDLILRLLCTSPDSLKFLSQSARSAQELASDLNKALNANLDWISISFETSAKRADLTAEQAAELKSGLAKAQELTKLKQGWLQSLLNGDKPEGFSSDKLYADESNHYRLSPPAKDPQNPEDTRQSLALWSHSCLHDNATTPETMMFKSLKKPRFPWHKVRVYFLSRHLIIYSTKSSSGKLDFEFSVQGRVAPALGYQHLELLPEIGMIV